jgi:hypothetical protein
MDDMRKNIALQIDNVGRLGEILAFYSQFLPGTGKLLVS